MWASTVDSGFIQQQQGYGNGPMGGNPMIFFRVIIDETQQTEGLGGFTTYRITTETNHQEYRESRLTVWRRYSDFVWLHSKLKEKYKTSLVPPLPEKEIFGKNDTAIVEYRRRELLRFLIRVTSHQKLALDKVLRHFLESSDEQLLSLKAQKSEPEKKAAAFSFFGLLKFSAPVEQDEWFSQKDNYFLNLDNRYSFAKKAAAFIALKNKEYAGSLLELCERLGELKEVEIRQDQDLASSLTKFAETNRKIASLFDELSVKQTQELADTLADHHRMIKAIRELLAYRQQLSSEYETAKSEFQAKKDPPQSLADEVGSRNQAFNQATEEIKSEIEKYEKLKSVEMRAALIRVTEANIAQYQNLLDSYQRARAELAKEPIL